MRLLPLLAARWLVPACLAPLSSIAGAQPGCEIDEAQRLFGEQPQPTAEVERLLEACRASGSTDYRVDMLLGVIARDAGDREQAIAHLRRAHAMAPEELNPALELGFTLETDDPREARLVYEGILARDAASRPALLGLARVARRQNRLDEARALYDRLLALNPDDPEALNGIAWLALAERKPAQARAEFAQVLEIDPDNAEAAAGLSNSRSVYRYLLDTNGIVVSTEDGTSVGVQARGMAGVSAFDTLELGVRLFSDELSTVSAIGLSTLPSQNITVGYHRLVPLSYAVSLVYDNRGYSELPTEHWIDGSLTIFLSEHVQWFTAYRHSFGAEQYEGHLVRTGLSTKVAPSWMLTATVYNSQQAAFEDYRDLWSGVVDVTYFGPRNTMVVVGVGTSPSIDNLDLHARAVLPVADPIGLQLIASHDTLNSATRLTAGLLFTW